MTAFSHFSLDQVEIFGKGVLQAEGVVIDKDGIVRWRWLEGAGGFADIAKFPPRDDIIAAGAAAQG